MLEPGKASRKIAIQVPPEIAEVGFAWARLAFENPDRVVAVSNDNLGVRREAGEHRVLPVQANVRKVALLDELDEV